MKTGTYITYGTVVNVRPSHVTCTFIHSLLVQLTQRSGTLLLNSYSYSYALCISNYLVSYYFSIISLLLCWGQSNYKTTFSTMSVLVVIFQVNVRWPAAAVAASYTCCRSNASAHLAEVLLHTRCLSYRPDQQRRSTKMEISNC